MARSYLRLPIEADEGFPQAFRFVVGDATYAASLYVNALDGDEPPYGMYDLARGSAFMVMHVVREGPAGPRTIFLRKLVANLEYEAAELAFVFRKLRVDPRNLHGAGAFGSSVRAGVAAR